MVRPPALDIPAHRAAAADCNPAAAGGQYPGFQTRVQQLLVALDVAKKLDVLAKESTPAMARRRPYDAARLLALILAQATGSRWQKECVPEAGDGRADESQGLACGRDGADWQPLAAIGRIGSGTGDRIRTGDVQLGKLTA